MKAKIELDHNSESFMEYKWFTAMILLDQDE